MKIKSFLKITLLFCLLFVINLNQSIASGLSDINGHKNETAIKYLYQKNVISGYPNGTFKPDITVNRVEFTKIIINASFSQKEIDSCIAKNTYSTLTYVFFPDVNKNAWYAKYICVAKVNGIIDGYPDKTFKPAATINKAEAIKIIVNSQKYSVPSIVSENIFSDVNNNAWYAPYIKAAKEKGILEKSSGQLGISASMTRAGISENIYRALIIKNKGLKSYSDSTNQTQPKTQPKPQIQPQPKTQELICDPGFLKYKNTCTKKMCVLFDSTKSYVYGFIGDYPGYSRLFNATSSAECNTVGYNFYKTTIVDSPINPPAPPPTPPTPPQPQPESQPKFKEAQVGQVPDLSQPFYSLKKTTGNKKVLTILWDPKRPEHTAPTKSTVENLLFGGKPSVKDYFRENSGGKFTIENAGVLGWYDAKKSADHYWSHPKDSCEDGFTSGHVEKWAEAIRKADKEVNFSQYDLDGNKVLSNDELNILIVIPQNSPFGTQRPVVGRQVPTQEPLIVDGVQIPTMVEAYIGSPPSLGLVAHELSHLLLGTGDMYFYFFQPYAAAMYSLMDQAHRNPTHLDPFHKLRLGWLTPKVITEDGWYKFRDVETSNEVHILYDPNRSNTEYFIIENRWPGNSYDSNLPSSGLAIWHIIEDPTVFDSLPTPPNVDSQKWNDSKWKGWSRRAIRMIRPIYGPPYNNALWDGSSSKTGYDLLSVDSNPNHVTLKWADGTPSGFAIKSISSAGKEMQAYVEVK